VDGAPSVPHRPRSQINPGAIEGYARLIGGLRAPARRTRYVQEGETTE
jgi:hypothetical protein